MIPKTHLPRLDPVRYRGCAYIFWTHATKNRTTGWLTPMFHRDFREVLLHTCARYGLSCPIYCLMPNHWHLVFIGQSEESDQLKATAFLHKQVAIRCSDLPLQDRAHDHILREEERKRDAFSDTCHYIRMNPVRAGIVGDWKEYPYLGAMISGYPGLRWGGDDLWDTFWKIHNRVSLY